MTNVASPQRVIRVARAYSVRKLSPGRLLAMAAVAPFDSEDPVDVALHASLRVNRPDIVPIRVPADEFSPATPKRKYSLVRVDDFPVEDVPKNVMIMRGDMESVLAKATISREERTLFIRNAEVMRMSGQRCLAVASAEIAEDGTVGEFFVEGFVAMVLEKPSQVAKKFSSNPNEWVRINIWSATLRFQHWANMALIVIMSMSGYYIMNPFFGPAAETGHDVGYLMGWVRLIHYVSAYLWLGLGFSRLVLSFTAKDRQLRWRSLWPLNSREDVKGLWGTIQYYLFLKKEGPLYLAHNPLQQFAYTGIYVMCLIQMLSGIVLYGLYNQTDWFWVIVAYPMHWMGVSTIRMIHALIMFVLWSFVIVHVYLATRADALERHGGVSSMVNGGVWLRRGAKPVDAPEIG
ncbi:Ni/Fe-hydrogenase, b-type cytochrome subunit [Corynebacterium durum]|jgi:Ni/Fe-hydrogenase, b-type cytochrome subunit|uniref:Ni/Fe-hydrogenase, b-type cytochrome subunit n=1 Tax=Corynebacterium durum TaxID=61592 RepID=UPI0015C6DADA|nr:Ni/Fe-hydrogenase, b-type cytochrome subunit [Corynebacterium durum]NYI75209.1 Ni/Fe-hydrogenase b-type cytochrome subunit [Corynebacterium durum]WJY84342.1 putative Ni/Fe-hydrogenase 1 B-type cytochrome subunit [Corynebacterium durum]